MPEPKRSKSPSTPLTDTIQANVNADLERFFEEFLNVGTIEERMFLREVFEWWESGHSGARDEIEIASAFQKEIRKRQPHVLHVMDRERDKMLEYLKTMREQDEPAGEKEPSAEDPKMPEPAKRLDNYEARRAHYNARAAQLQSLFEFFCNGHNLELFEYLQILASRNGGSSTPIETSSLTSFSDTAGQTETARVSR